MRIIIVAMTLCMALHVSAPAQVDEARKRFEAKLATLEESDASKQQRKGLTVQYLIKLETLENKLAASGDLDGVLAIRDERTRFEKSRQVETSDLVKQPIGLRQLQTIFIETAVGFDADRAKRTEQLVAQYIKALEEQQKRLVVADQIDEALAAKKEIERVQEAYSLEGGQPAPAAGPRAPKISGTGLARGLVLYWSFDEDEPGKVLDRSGKNHTGDIYGRPSYVDGVKGKALKISSARDYVQCDAKSFNIEGWRGGTVSVWFNMQRTTTYGTLMSKSPLSSTKVNPRKSALLLTLGGNYGRKHMSSVLGFGGDYVQLNSYGANREEYPYPPLNTWQHLLITTDGRVTRFYLNGELDTEHIAEEPKPTLVEPDWNPFTLGKHRSYRGSWSDSYPNGKVDELMFWSRTMSAAEVKAIYERGQAELDR